MNDKLMKRLVVMVYMFLLCAAGCTQGGGSMTAVDISDLIARQEKALNEINSCRANAYLEIRLKSGADGSASMSVTANMKTSIDGKNRLLSSVIDSTFIISGNKKEAQQRLIADGENIYRRNNTLSAKERGWQVRTLDQAAAEKLWNEQRLQQTGLKYSKLLSPKNYVYTGKEKSNGRTCLVLKQTLDTERLLEVSSELKEQLQNGRGIIPEELEKMLKTAEVVCLIDEETYYLREFRLDAQINGQAAGTPITGTVKQYCRYDAFNEPVLLEIPKDAKPDTTSAEQR